MSASQTADVPTLLVKIFGKDRPGHHRRAVRHPRRLLRGRGRHRAGRHPWPHRAVRSRHRAPPAAAAEGELRATVHSWAESMKLQAEIISGTRRQPAARQRPFARHRARASAHRRVDRRHSRRITATGGNIDRIFRLAKYPVTAVEFAVSGVETEPLRTALATEAARHRRRCGGRRRPGCTAGRSGWSSWTWTRPSSRTR